jgi:hypothetical protein
MVLQKNPHIQGRPLVEVLVDPEVPTALKLELRRKYTNWMDEIWAALLRRGYDAERVRPEMNYFRNHQKLATETQDFLKSQPPILRASLPWHSLFGEIPYDRTLFQQLNSVSKGGVNALLSSHEDIMIILKSDNVFVDDAGELVLFDPM